MQIIRGVREEPDQPIVGVLRAAAQDPNLSLKELGALLRLMSRPDDWTTDYKQTARESADGADSVRTAFAGLQRKGYLARKRVRDAQGRIRTVTAVSDIRGAASSLLGTGAGFSGTGSPGTGGPGTGSPRTGLPGTGSPGTGSPGPGSPGPGKPGTYQEGETDVETPPPTPPTPAPLPAEQEELLGGVVDRIKQKRLPRPNQRVLVELVRELAGRGWTREQLVRAVDAHDWQGLRGAGAVVAWLRDRAGEDPPAAGDVDDVRPPWCGRCDPRTRFLEDPATGAPRSCPDCSPRALTPTPA